MCKAEHCPCGLLGYAGKCHCSVWNKTVLVSEATAVHSECKTQLFGASLQFIGVVIGNRGGVVFGLIFLISGPDLVTGATQPHSCSNLHHMTTHARECQRTVSLWPGLQHCAGYAPRPPTLRISRELPVRGHPQKQIYGSSAELPKRGCFRGQYLTILHLGHWLKSRVVATESLYHVTAVQQCMQDRFGGSQSSSQVLYHYSRHLY